MELDMEEIAKVTQAYRGLDTETKRGLVDSAIKAFGSQKLLAEATGLYQTQISHARRGLISHEVFFKVVDAFEMKMQERSLEFAP